MSEPDRIQILLETLLNCRVELDRVGADVAAAHVDTALHALRAQFSLPAEASDTV